MADRSNRLYNSSRNFRVSLTYAVDSAIINSTYQKCSSSVVRQRSVVIEAVFNQPFYSFYNLFFTARYDTSAPGTSQDLFYVVIELPHEELDLPF